MENGGGDAEEESLGLSHTLVCFGVHFRVTEFWLGTNDSALCAISGESLLLECPEIYNIEMDGVLFSRGPFLVPPYTSKVSVNTSHIEIKPCGWCPMVRSQHSFLHNICKAHSSWFFVLGPNYSKPRITQDCGCEIIFSQLAIVLLRLSRIVSRCLPTTHQSADSARSSTDAIVS